MLPFSFVEEDADGRNLFAQLLYACRPGFAKKYMPSAQTLSNNLLDGLYNETRDNVDNAINKSLQGSYATIMFDGWEEKVTEDSVVNVLLRIPEPTPQFQQTFFLDAIFTEKEKVSSSKYVDIVLYLEGGTITDEQREQLGISNNTDFRTFLGSQFLRVRSAWQQAYQMQNANWKVMICYKNSPSSWWKHLALCSFCSSTFQTFALRTLDVSSSSCAVERSFKTQKRIRSDVRNRFSTEKVHKIMFSSWNYSLLNREKEEVGTKLRKHNIWSEKGEISHASASERLKTVPAEDNVINSRIVELTDVYSMDESSPSHEAKTDRYLHQDSFEDHKPDLSSEDWSSEEEAVARSLFVETREENRQ